MTVTRSQCQENPRKMVRTHLERLRMMRVRSWLHQRRWWHNLKRRRSQYFLPFRKWPKWLGNKWKLNCLALSKMFLLCWQLSSQTLRAWKQIPQSTNKCRRHFYKILLDRTWSKDWISNRRSKRKILKISMKSVRMATSSLILLSCSMRARKFQERES